MCVCLKKKNSQIKVFVRSLIHIWLLNVQLYWHPAVLTHLLVQPTFFLLLFHLYKFKFFIITPNNIKQHRTQQTDSQPAIHPIHPLQKKKLRHRKHPPIACFYFVTYLLEELFNFWFSFLLSAKIFPSSTALQNEWKPSLCSQRIQLHSSTSGWYSIKNFCLVGSSLNFL